MTYATPRETELWEKFYKEFAEKVKPIKNYDAEVWVFKEDKDDVDEILSFFLSHIREHYVSKEEVREAMEKLPKCPHRGIEPTKLFSKLDIKI